jgi:hypothetical protein
MNAWMSGGATLLIINLASDPRSALVEVNSQGYTPADLTTERLYWLPSSRLEPILGYAAVNIGYQCHKR